MLLTTSGASRFVIDAQIPYSPEALFAYLGEEVEQSCSSSTVRKLAVAALKSQASGLKPISVACSAALQTDRERRGDDRAFICIKTEKVEKLYSLHFSKTSRQEQEALLSDWLLVLIAQAVGAERGLMLPGSFNPVHKGHLGMLKAAEEITGLRGVFELSCTNVDKPELSEEEIRLRVSAIRDIPVALTSAPRFTQKAELFPNTTFVLGHDTAERLVTINHTLQGMVSEVSQPWKNQWEFFQALETSFLVAGRKFQPLEKDISLATRSAETRRSRFQCLDLSDRERAFGGSQKKRPVGERQIVGAGDDRARRARLQNFQTLEKLEIPEDAVAMFDAIPESTFREDISSTELRDS
jgi:hypothetical protein